MDELYSTPDTSSAVQSAHLLLKQFDCLKSPLSITPQERSQLRQAILLVANESDYQMLGICADDLNQGQQALEAYTKALGYAVKGTLAAIEGPVYIKFNPNAGSCYASPYVGEHRGVLVSCQSADESGINEIYGHLPIDLFAPD